MNLDAWNEAFFQKLVKDVGRPGDPLYFYVDADVLADISGIDDPDMAVDAFADEFRKTSFDESLRKAVAWRTNGFRGTPFFLSALAITVLAVTLEPLGASSNNVYSRQRALLFLGKTGGMPEGYDQVREIWSIWNQWLECEDGRKYGTATAREGSYPIQGFARSQAFLRYADKQDIYNFFKATGDNIPQNATGPELVAMLSAWLGQQGSPSRLARAAGNEGLRDELGQALVASRKFWVEEEQTRHVDASFGALALWDPDEDALHLVVPLAHEKGAVGASLMSLDQVEWEFDGSVPHFYLTTPDTDPASWLDEVIEDWELNDTWSAVWVPPEDGIHLFVQDEDGLQWVGTKKPQPHQVHRVLVGPAGEDKILDAVIAMSEDVDGGVEVSFIDGPVRGHHWLSLDGDTNVSAKAAARIKGLEAKRAVRRNHRLSGGLKLIGNTYLNGFEPDIAIPNQVLREAMDAKTGPVVKVDGVRCEGWITDVDTGELLFPLTGETLDPGEHFIEVRVGDVTHRSNIYSQQPQSPALPRPRRKKHVRDHIARFSLDRNRDPQVLMINDEGEIFEITPSTEIRYWLRILGDKDQDIADFESYFDSSWLDWIYPVPGQKAGTLLFAVREAEGRPWKILKRKGSLRALQQSSRFESMDEASAWSVMDLVGDKAECEFVDEGAEDWIRQIRTDRSRHFTQRFERRSRQSWRLHGHRPPIASKSRPDITTKPQYNPYERLLWWLAEKGECGALSSTVESAFNWLCKEAGFPDTPDFKQTIRNMEALGHVYRSGSKIYVRPASLTWLPDSEALASIGGERSQETVGALVHGSGAETDEQDDALQATVAHSITQTRPHPDDPSRVIPIAPKTVFVQLGSRSRTVSQQAQELGFEFFDPSIRELQSFPDLNALLLEESRRIPTTELKGRIGEFVPSSVGAGGRWRRLSGNLTDLDNDAFLKVQTVRGPMYAWWSVKEQRLVNCGWVNGVWGFHRNTRTQDLFALVREKDRFAVWDAMPLDPRIEEFLVMRSGLLPRVGVDEGTSMWAGKPRRWRVYTNVPPSVAAVVSQKLGHRWSPSKGSGPSDLTRLEFPW